MLELRPTRLADLPHLLAWTPDAGALALWSGPTLTWPLTLPALEAMLAEAPALRRTHLTAVPGGEAGGGGAGAEPAPVGHASITVSEDGTSARLGRIVLDPARRGRGEGRALVDAVVARAEELPVDRLTLGVFVGNDVARRHYARHGFAPTGETTTMQVDGVTLVSEEMARRITLQDKPIG